MKPHISLAMVFTAWASFASLALAAPPEIEISCRLLNIEDDELRGHGISADVEFKWSATNADYVLVGEEKQHYPIQGRLIKPEGGSYTFAAVRGDIAIRTHKTCSHSWGFDSKIRGRHGVFHKIDYQFYPDIYFSESYRHPHVLRTTLADAEVLRRLDAAIQGDHDSARQPYTVVQYSHTPPNLIVYTKNYVFHPMLCQGADCRKPVGRRVVERQAAYSVWLKKTETDVDGASYELYLLPFVVRNWRKENTSWEPDPDALEVASAFTHKLASQIEANLK